MGVLQDVWSTNLSGLKWRVPLYVLHHREACRVRASPADATALLHAACEAGLQPNAATRHHLAALAMMAEQLAPSLS